MFVVCYTDLLQGHIRGRSCPLLCSPPPVWHQGGWDTELWEGPGHLRCKKKNIYVIKQLKMGKAGKQANMG